LGGGEGSEIGMGVVRGLLKGHNNKENTNKKEGEKRKGKKGKGHFWLEGIALFKVKNHMTYEHEYHVIESLI
jgi:hypothetical protein